MEAASKVIIDYRDNPDLREIFSRKELGETCDLKLRLLVSQKSTDGAEGVIESITPGGYYTESDNPPKKVRPSSNEPVMMKMMPQRSPAEDGDTTARIPKGLLEKKMALRGDKITVEVVAVRGDHYEVKLSNVESTNAELDAESEKDTGYSDHQNRPVRTSEQTTAYA